MRPPTLLRQQVRDYLSPLELRSYWLTNFCPSYRRRAGAGREQGRCGIRFSGEAREGCRVSKSNVSMLFMRSRT
jgi:hypothetical protein